MGNSDAFHFSFSVVVLGDTHTGKSSLISCTVAFLILEVSVLARTPMMKVSKAAPFPTQNLPRGHLWV